MDGIKKKVNDMKPTGRTHIPVFPVATDSVPLVRKPPVRIAKTPVIKKIYSEQDIAPSRSPLADAVYLDARNRNYRRWTIVLFLVMCFLGGILGLLTYVFDATTITVEPVTYHHEGSIPIVATPYPAVRSLQYFVITDDYTQSEPIDTVKIYTLLKKQIPPGSFSSPALLTVSVSNTETSDQVMKNYQASLLFFKQSDIANYIREYVFQTRFPVVFSGLDTLTIVMDNPVFINAKTPTSSLSVTLSGTISGTSYINPDTVRDLALGVKRSDCRHILENNETIGINRALCHVLPIWRLRTSDGQDKITMKLENSN